LGALSRLRWRALEPLFDVVHRRAVDGREVHPNPRMRGQPCLCEFPPWMLRLSQSTWISVTDAGVVLSMTSSNSMNSMNSICRLRRRRIPTIRPVRVSNAATRLSAPCAHLRARPQPACSTAAPDDCAMFAFAAEATSSRRATARARGGRACGVHVAAVVHDLAEVFVATGLRAEPVMYPPGLSAFPKRGFAGPTKPRSCRRPDFGSALVG
jgi:hypothetical protein